MDRLSATRSIDRLSATQIQVECCNIPKIDELCSASNCPIATSLKISDRFSG